MNLSKIEQKGYLGLNVVFGLAAIALGVIALVRVGPYDQVRVACVPGIGSLAGQCYGALPCSLIIFGAFCLVLIPKFGYKAVLMTISALGLFDFTLSSNANPNLPHTPPISFLMWFIMIVVPIVIVSPSIRLKFLVAYLFGALIFNNYVLPDLALYGVFPTSSIGQLLDPGTRVEILTELAETTMFYLTFSPKSKPTSIQESIPNETNPTTA